MSREEFWMTNRANVMLATSFDEADAIKSRFPQYRFVLVQTPGQDLPDQVLVGEYVWTPNAAGLSARVRLRMRGVLSLGMDDESVEEEFPDTLLSW